MAPELAAEVEKILKPLKGRDLDAGRSAVTRVYRSGMAGGFGDLVAAYREAIEEAVTAP
jgi:hypothetical protein